MRFYASSMVFIVHAFNLFDVNVGSLIANFADLGKYGVEVFFVVSGFTIAFQTLNSGYNSRRFILLRLCRIAIPYYPILLILIFFPVLRDDSWVNFFQIQSYKFSLDMILHLLFLGSFFPVYSNTIIGVEWTLGIEVAIYLVFYFILQKNKDYLFRKIYMYIFIYIIYIIVGFLVKIIGTHYTDAMYHFTIFKWFHLFSLGYLSYLIRYQIVKFNLYIFISGLILFLVSGLISLDFMFSNVFGLITFVLLVYLNDQNNLRIFTNKLTLFLGKISFSFYLIHLIVIRGLILLNFPNLGVAFILSVIVSLLWYYIFEKWIYRKIRRVLL